jgi:hypothetical protein
MGLFTAVFETNYFIRGIQTWQTAVNVKLADADLEITGVNLFFPTRIQRQRNMLNFRTAERAFGA